MDAQRLLNGTEDGVHRVERTVGVLEHRLHVAAEAQKVLGLERGGVATFIEHFAGGGLQEVKHHVRHGGLAGTGFAHNGQCGATLDGEGHVIDGLEHLLLAGQLEFLGQVVDGDDVLALFERAFAGDVVIEQSVRILTTLLGGDDALGGQRRGSGHQSLGVRVLRVLEHFKGWAGFDDLTLVHHDNVLGALSGKAQIVGDEQHGGAQRVGEHVQVVEDALLHGHVEGGGRLVGDQQIGAAGQADGDERALAHTTGELVRELTGTGSGVGQTGLGQQTRDTVIHCGAGDVLLSQIPGLVVGHAGLDEVVGHAPTGFGARNPFVGEAGDGLVEGLAGHAGFSQSLLGLGHELGQFLGAEEGLVVVALDFDLVAGQSLGKGGALFVSHVHVVGLQCFLDLGADTPHRVEVAHRVLRHETHPGAAQLVELALLGAGDFLAVKLDGAVDHVTGAGQQAQHSHGGGGFAGAGFAHDGHPLAGVDGEVGVAHRMHRLAGVSGEVDGQILDLEQRTMLFLHSQHLGVGVVSHNDSPLPSLRPYGSSGRGRP